MRQAKAIRAGSSKFCHINPSKSINLIKEKKRRKTNIAGIPASKTSESRILSLLPLKKPKRKLADNPTIRESFLITSCASQNPKKPAKKVNKKKGLEIKDITLDLDLRQEKPDWVYLNEEQIKKLCNKAKYEYKVLIMFLYDTGIRSPTELINVRISDFYNDYKELNIREEISKTFGRKIKLMLCSNLIKEYIKEEKLKADDQLFNIKPYSVNKYLKTLSKRIFGDSKSLAGKKYSELTMYDFRHCSCCFWLPRYKSESALKYRFGWKGSDKIHYYSELLGMKDTIAEEDLLVDTTKTDIERKLEKSEKEKEIMQERMQSMEEQMKRILEVVNGMVEKVKD